MGAVVVDQVIENLAKVDVGSAAERDDRRKSDAVGLRPVENGRAHGTGLRNEGQVAGVGGNLGEGGVEAQRRADDAEAVRAEYADVVAARDLQHLAFQRSTGVACLGKACGDDDDVLDAAATALFDDGRNRLRPGTDHCQFDPSPDFLD